MVVSLYMNIISILYKSLTFRGLLIISKIFLGANIWLVMAFYQEQILSYHVEAKYDPPISPEALPYKPIRDVPFFRLSLFSINS